MIWTLSPKNSRRFETLHYDLAGTNQIEKVDMLDFSQNAHKLQSSTLFLGVDIGQIHKSKQVELFWLGLPLD